MSDWLSTLAAQLAEAAERGDPAGPWVQLATVGLDGAPAVRTVVYRGQHQGALLFTSDVRAAKVRHIAHDPRVELAWNFAHTRTQLRVAGKMVAVVSDSADPGLTRAREAVWQALSGPVRAGFVGGPPGRPLDEPRITDETPAADGPPPTFALLVLWPERVDQVELTPQPHRRTLHAKDAAGRWHARAVHP